MIGAEFAGDEPNAAGATVMFHLDGGLTFACYPRSELAKDANVPVGPPKTGEYSIGHAVASKADVDAPLAQTEAAGATVTERPRDRPWGIDSRNFRDLDGLLSEIMGSPEIEDL